MSNPIRVTFCGGGSGGHLTPAIAIADALRSINPDVRLSFLTSSREIDRSIIDDWKVDKKEIQFEQLPLATSRHRIVFGLKLIFATVRCLTLMRSRRPSVVLGLGGFASVPGVIAARILRIPVALLETNCVPGRANRFLSRWARITFTGWKLIDSARTSWKSHVLSTGVPIRQQFADCGTKQPAAHKTLLVLGGSQGASSLNDLVIRSVLDSSCLPENWRVVHQTGPNEFEVVAERYSATNAGHEVCAFVRDVPTALRSSSILITRAGAVTLAEAAACSCASIIVPMMRAADGHQMQNAKHLADYNAAIVIDESDPDAATILTDAIKQLVSSENDRKKLSNGIAKLSPTDAAECVAQQLIQIANGRTESAAT